MKAVGGGIGFGDDGNIGSGNGGVVDVGNVGYSIGGIVVSPSIDGVGSGGDGCSKTIIHKATLTTTPQTLKRKER